MRRQGVQASCLFLCLLVGVLLPEFQIGKSPQPVRTAADDQVASPYNLKKGTPPCLTETPSTPKKPSRVNSGVKQGSGCRREHKPFGTADFLTKQQRCTPSSPEDLLWASDHEEPRRSIPKAPQVTCTPLPTQVRRRNKF